MCALHYYKKKKFVHTIGLCQFVPKMHLVTLIEVGESPKRPFKSIKVIWGGLNFSKCFSIDFSSKTIGIENPT